MVLVDSDVLIWYMRGNSRAKKTIDGLGPMGANGHCSERSEDGSKDQEYANKSSFVPKTVLNFFAIRELIAGS